jgi:tetratricopeptide (TPR) repeat protein
MPLSWHLSPTGWLLVPIAALCVFLAGFHSVIDPDIWFHLRAGREILAGHLPRTDTFSFPSAGSRYVDLHWMFQAIAAIVFRAGGEPALVWMSCLAVLGTYAIVFRLACRHAPAPLAAVLVALGAVVSSERFSPRPEILSFLWFALSAWLLQRHREGSRRAAWAFPVVMLLWVNSEGLFILGFLLLGAAILDGPQDRRLWQILGLSVAAAFVNPWFAEGAIHPFVLFTRISQAMPIYSRTIGEFLGPFHGEAVHPAAIVFPFYLGVIGLALVAVGRWPRRGELLVTAALVYLSFTARRNLALLPIVVTPVLARWLRQGWAWPWAESRLRGLASSVRSVVSGVATGVALLGLGWFALGLASNRIYAHAETNRQCGSGSAPTAFPRGAGRFLRDNRIPGPLFTTFAAGSYLTAAYPEEKVFIDGRLEVHSAAHYERYLRMLQGGPAWQQADAQYRFNAAVVQYMDAMELVLERLRDPGWAPVFLDDNAIVFLRQNAANQKIIERDGITEQRIAERFPSLDAAGAKGVRVPSVPSWAARHFGVVRFPWSEMNLGQFLLAIGRDRFAGAQFAAGSAAAPAMAAPRVMLASVLSRMGEPAAALAALESARRLGGGRVARARAEIVHGDILAALGRPEEAVAAYDRALPASTSPPQTASLLASRAQAKLQAGDTAGAAGDIDESLRALPGNPQGWLVRAMIEEKRGNRGAALQAYQRCRDLGGQTPQVLEAIRRLGG